MAPFFFTRCGTTDASLKPTLPTPYPRYGLRAGEFPLKVHHWTRDRFGIHGHHYLELMVVTETAGTQWLNGRARPMKRGEVYFLGPFVDHRGAAKDGRPLGHYAIDFLPEALGPARDVRDWDELMAPFFLPQPKPLVLGDGALPRVLDLCATLLAECERPRPWGESIAGRTLAILLYELRRANPAAPHAGDKALVPALRYIHDHFKEGFTPAELSLAAGKSYSRLTQLFRASFSRSPREILVHRRLMEARRLLIETESPLAQVLSRCGFSDASYFHRAFVKATGQTPGDFRRANRSQAEVHGGMAPVRR